MKDRTVHEDGSRYFGSHTSAGVGHFGGWDRYGRLTRNSWVRSGFADNGWQPVWQERYSYDLATRRLERENTKTIYEYTDEDWQFGYDGLSRLTLAERGDLQGGSFAAAAGSKEWELDELGNWKNFRVPSALTPLETRGHNLTNEITDIGGSHHRFYDPNGNLLLVATDSSGQTGITEEYTYDAWNRLVNVGRESGDASPDECE